MTVSKSTSGEAHYLKTTPVTTPFIYEITYLDGNTNDQEIGLRGHSALAKSPSYWLWFAHWNNKFWTVGSRSGYDKMNNYNCTLNKGDIVKIEVNGTTAKIYHNNVLQATGVLYTVPETLYIGFYTNKGRTQTVKDLKIKPYSV